MSDVAKELVGPDLVLLLLAAPTKLPQAQDRIDGVTRLEKLLFLAQREKQIDRDVRDAPVFEPYHYGPYSKQVYEAIELLESFELVGEERVLDDETSEDEMEEMAATSYEREGTERRFVLSDKGKAVARLLLKNHPDTAARLTEVKDEYAGIPLRTLLRYVYAKYPRETVRSRIADKL